MTEPCAVNWAGQECSHHWHLPDYQYRNPKAFSVPCDDLDCPQCKPIRERLEKP